MPSELTPAPPLLVEDDHQSVQDQTMEDVSGCDPQESNHDPPPLVAEDRCNELDVSNELPPAVLDAEPGLDTPPALSPVLPEPPEAPPDDDINTPPRLSTPPPDLVNENHDAGNDEMDTSKISEINENRENKVEQENTGPAIGDDSADPAVEQSNMKEQSDQVENQTKGMDAGNDQEEPPALLESIGESNNQEDPPALIESLDESKKKEEEEQNQDSSKMNREEPKNAVEAVDTNSIHSPPAEEVEETALELPNENHVEPETDNKKENPVVVPPSSEALSDAANENSIESEAASNENDGQTVIEPPMNGDSPMSVEEIPVAQRNGFHHPSESDTEVESIMKSSMKPAPVQERMVVDMSLIDIALEPTEDEAEDSGHEGLTSPGDSSFSYLEEESECEEIELLPDGTLPRIVFTPDFQVSYFSFACFVTEISWV